MRYWRVAANFHRIGDVMVTVDSPNWQGGLRKAALTIKKLPILKGKRLNSGSFMLTEVEAPTQVEQVSEQLALQPQPEQQAQTPLTTTSEPETEG